MEKKLIRFETFCQKFQISHSTGYKWTSQGRIKHYKIGKLLFFFEDELFNHIEQNGKETKEVIEAGAINSMIKRRR